MTSASREDFLLQRWTTCLACGVHFDNVLYRCLQCSDSGSYHHSQATPMMRPKSVSADASRSQASLTSPSPTPSNVSTSFKDGMDTSPLIERAIDERTSDAFHVCPACVRKASLFHPVRHTFARVDIPWVVRSAGTSSFLKHTDETLPDYFDGPESRFHAIHSCTFGRHRSKLVSAEDVVIWESFIHQRIMSVPGARSLKTISTKYHKQRCDRCHARISGIRWERLCMPLPIESTSPTSTPASGVASTATSTATSTDSSSATARTTSSASMSSSHTASTNTTSSSTSSSSTASSGLSKSPSGSLPHSDSPSATHSMRAYSHGDPSIAYEDDHLPFNIGSLGSMASIGSIASLISTGISSSASAASPSPSTHSSNSSNTVASSGSTSARNRKSATFRGDASGQSSIPFTKAMSLCVLCFDTLHSDFASEPLGHKKIQTPEHEDQYYRGYLWAHVRSLFDSATQPLNQSLADEEEALKLDQVNHHHHHHHRHHSRSTTSTTVGDSNLLRSASQTTTSETPQVPSQWERRHIGSDQSVGAGSSSSGSGAYGLVDSSSSSARSHSTPFTKTVRIGTGSEGLSEWVLMTDPNGDSDEDSYDGAGHHGGNHGDSSQSSDSESDEMYPSFMSVATQHESLLDAGTRQALNFIDQDDIMRPLEINQALQPFVDSRRAAASGRARAKIAADDDEPQTSTLAEDAISIEEPEPVFELTAELKNELARHKARSVFEYGLDRGFSPLPPISQLPPLSALPPLPPSMLTSMIDPYGPVPSPYDAPKMRNVKESTPPGYASVTVSSPYSSTGPSSGYDGSDSKSFTSSSAPSSGYSNPVPSSSPPGAVSSSPYSAPSPDGQIGSSTPPYTVETAQKPLSLDPYGTPTVITSTSRSEEASNAPYYSQSEIPRELPVENDLGRDWNAEWQTMLEELRDHRLECLYLLVTEPSFQDDDQDKGIATLMNDAAAMAGDGTSLECFVSLLADEAAGNADNVYDRISQFESKLGELATLKSEKSGPAQLMLAIIKVKRFMKEFIGTANNIAKTIVSEVSLPLEGKTIKPRRMGGIAGGEKYLEQGIFFKFAIDAYKVYGGDKFAMKAASHEIQGLKAFAETENEKLCIPLSCIIDYAGYRVVASARLPISQDTLIYGSSDGGMTIHRKDPEFNQMMETAAEQLNIKAHEVAPGIVLHSAVDMEGHKGTDGRYYVLDTARVFPPEPPLRTFVAVIIPADTTSSHKWAPSAPICEMELIAQRSRWEEQVRAYLRTGHRDYDDVHVNLIDGQVWHLDDPEASLPLNSRASSLVSRVVRGPAVYVVEPGQKSTQLFNLLRASHVARQPHPLSSDAFTSFGRIDQDIHNTEVEDAFYRLLGIDIINFVKYITSRETFDLTHENLITTIKSFGINFRLLGFLRSHIPIEPANRALRSMLLVEMVTRVVKNDIRASLRNARRLSKNADICITPSICERQAHEIILSSFNLLLGNSTSSNFMWHSFIKTHLICKYGQYGQTLTEAELDATYDLRVEVNKLQLLQTLSSQLGVQFKDSVMLKFQKHPDFFESTTPFGPDDIEVMIPKPKMLLQLKLRGIFQTTMKVLPSVQLRMEAMRGFYGENSHEIGYIALTLAHVLNRFEKTRAKVGPLLELVFQSFKERPSATPAEVTCKAFYLLGTASMADGNLELAEAQLKASYYCYRRAISDYVAGRPMELGATFLLIILDRLVRLMYQQQRKFEAWYYAQKFVRVWTSTPYPGDVKDLEGIMGRPTPWAFALLWERDYYFGSDRKLFLQHGSITDTHGNIYSNSEDFMYDRKSGHVARRTNLEDENLQELPELTPEARIQLEYELSHPKRASPQLAHHWRSTFKTVDHGSISGYTMAGSVWTEWIESGAWKKERAIDSSALKTAIWTPAVSPLYNKSIHRPTPVDHSLDDVHITETLTGVTNASQLKPHHSGDIKHSHSGKTSLASPPNSSLDSLHSSGSSAQLALIGASNGSTLPISQIAGTIRAPHVLRSGHVSNYSFRWHLGREWSHEVTGGEYFVLVRLEPSVWIVPSIVSGSKTSVDLVGKEGRRLLTGTLVGQFMDGEHEIIASMPARLLRTFGIESFYDLKLDYGFYQVYLVDSHGQLFGKNTKKPCFVVSNQTIVLNESVKSHILRWNDQYHWLTSAMQAQGITMTSLAAIPLGPKSHMSYWVDSDNQLWYGFSDMASYVPKYLTQQYPIEEVHNFQTHPVVVPSPSDFAITFQQFARNLGSNIDRFTSKDKTASAAASTILPVAKSTSSKSTGISIPERSPSTNSMMPYTLPDSPRSYQDQADTITTASTSKPALETSSTASTNSKASSASSRAAVQLVEGFFQEEGGCKDCSMNEVSVVNFDAHGVRIPLGSNAVPHNSLMSLKSVETQLSDHVMWTKMRKVPSLASEKVLKVVASNTHVMALLENGDVYTWGNNLYGELGHGDLVRSDEPRVVKRLRGKQVRDISCGVGRSVALLAGNRAVYQWGMDFSFFPEPHPFWKSLPDEEVTKVIFQSQNGPGTPNTPQEWTSMPSVPREVASYGTFDPVHSSSSNAIWHSNIVLYLTDTGRVYIYGHDPHQIIFKMQKPILLDIFNNYPIMDAVIGSNFVAFLGEKGYVYTTGHNELGQRGTGLVGDCEMTIDAALKIPLSSSSGTHTHLPVDQTHSNNATTGKSSKGDMKSGSGSNAASWDGLNAAFERLSKSPYSKDPTANRGPWNSDPSISRREDDPSSLGAAPQRTLAQARRGHHDVVTPHASTGTRRNGGHQHSVFYDSHHSGLHNSHQRRAVEDEKLGHAMNTASIPSISTKVSFPETTQIAKLSARGKKIYALATDGRVWHWGEGTYIPTIVEAVEQFIVVDVLAVPGGSAIFHTGPAPLPAPILTERGKARRKALGLESPNCYNISARQMLWTPNGLKPYSEGAAIPPKCHLVVTVDWKRPPSSMIDRGEQIRWVTPGHDTIVGLQRNASEYSEPLLSLPQRQGTLVLDYLSPKVVRWSVDQGIASGQIDHHLEPLLQWAPLTDESRETLTRRRDRRAALVRSLLKDYQARMHAEARQLAEAKFAESRISVDSTASGRSSTTHGHGGVAMMNTSSGSAISNQQPTQSSDRPPLPHAKSRQSLREVSSSGSLTSVHSALSASPVGTGQIASSSVKSQAAAAGGTSSVWDPSAAFIDIDSASTGIPASIDDLNDSSLSSDFDPEEYAPMVPPGEYQAIYVITKPTFQILARSAPVKFTYEGIKASIDIESTTVVGDKPVTAHWKCEMKLGGIHIVARELESTKIVHSEALRQRTSDTIRWKLPAGSSYRIFIERTDVNGTTVLCESSVVEVMSGANPALSAFGNASMLAALSTMPSEVETCSEWSTFFKKCNLTPEFVVRYSSLLMAANISTTFIPALDSGILEKLGITNLQHQVQIMTTTMKYREAHVRAILTQELQKICDSCSSDSQYPQSFSSSFHSQM